jgi:drug/metabolite transporter (DMT)-like permease
VPPKPIIWTALLFGISAVSAIWVFQHGIHYGKIATSWTILNLSAAIPAVLSTMIYKERMSPIKLIILMAIVLAILLLYKDMKDETSHG